jgi:glycosyltransferase involved in cell wall biosynthesis
VGLRIAHVTATYPPSHGGTGNVCYYHARHLARRGHDVRVLTAAVPDAPAHEVVDGVELQRLTPLLRIGNAPLLPGLVAALRGFDLIHLHYPFIFGAEMVRVAALRFRTPLVVSFHNDLVGDGLRAPLFAAYQAASANVSLRGAERLCALSFDHYGASRLSQALRWRGPQVEELSNGVDTGTFNPNEVPLDLSEAYGIPRDAKVVLFVAALDRAHHFKGLSTLLRAAQTLPEYIRLLIVGDGDLRDTYEREAWRHGVAGRAVFAGAVEHARLAPVYRSADVTVLPSSPPESFGMVLVESMACGTPVIASNIPGVRTVVDHETDGLLVPAGDARALSLAIQRMLADDIRREMALKGLAKVRSRYDWQMVVERLEALYVDIIAARQVAPAYAPMREN